MKKISTLIIAGLFAVPSTGYAMNTSEDSSYNNQNDFHGLEALYAAGRVEAERRKALCPLSYYPANAAVRQVVENPDPTVLAPLHNQSFYVPRRANSHVPGDTTEDK